jgi:hypothetical protein
VEVKIDALSSVVSAGLLDSLRHPFGFRLPRPEVPISDQVRVEGTLLVLGA